MGTVRGVAGTCRRAPAALGCMAALALVCLVAGAANAGIIVTSDIRFVSAAVDGQDYHGPVHDTERVEHTRSGGLFDEAADLWLATASQDSWAGAGGIRAVGSVSSDEYFDGVCDEHICYSEYLNGTGMSQMAIRFYVKQDQPFHLIGDGYTGVNGGGGSWLRLTGGAIDIDGGDGGTLDVAGVFLPGTSYLLAVDIAAGGPYDSGAFDVQLMAPEPGTGLLVGLGLSLLAVRRRGARGR